MVAQRLRELIVLLLSSRRPRDAGKKQALAVTRRDPPQFGPRPMHYNAK
jgi:hypothetical protein